jgi:ribosomal protein L16 Arg81 hydroxylase
MITTLADLLAPVSLPEFLEVFRARKRLHISASDPTRAQTLFSWHDIETLLSGHGLDENVSIQRDGALVPRKLYVSSEGKHLNVRALHDLLTQGVSIIVNAVDHSIPQIRQLAAAIEREMGIRTFVNAYLSFAKGGAFKPHWDTHDVLAIQVHGNKRWRIWNAVVPHPVEMANDMQINASAPPDQEIELAAGDVLFIPRGEPHAANVSAARSVHLTIGLESRTGIDFLNYICREAAKDPILRMDLPHHSFAEHRDAHEAALKRQVHHLIDAVSISQFLQKDDLSRLPTSQTAVAGALPQIDDVLRLTLRRRVPLPDVAQPGGGPQPVTVGGETRRLSPAAIDVLRWLFDHDIATLRALHVGLTPHRGPDATEAAIRELLRFGFVVVNRAG